MKRTLLVAVALLAPLTACGGSSTVAPISDPSASIATNGASAIAEAPTGTATAATTACTPSATGTKDLTTKPVYTVPKAPPPTVTTSTDIVCGTGAEAADGSNVQVQYVGVNYVDGKQFDSSWERGQPLPFTVGSGVIPGFTKGVTGMKVGGRRLVVIPPADGYGNAGPVPGGTLAFLIDLVSVG